MRAEPPSLPRLARCVGGLVALLGGPCAGGAARAAPVDAPSMVAVAPLAGPGGSACARTLRGAALDLGWAVAAPLKPEPEARDAPARRAWVRAAARSAGAGLVLLGDLEARKIVLQLFSAEGGLVGSRALRTAGRCGLTERGLDALKQLLEHGAARRAGRPPYGFTPEEEPAARGPRPPASTSAARPSITSTASGRSGPRPELAAQTARPGARGATPGAKAPPAGARAPGPAPGRASGPPPAEPQGGAGASSETGPEPEAAAPLGLGPRRAYAVRITLGVGLVSRDLRFEGARDPALLNLQAPGAAELAVELAMRPFAALPLLAGLELAAGHAESVGQTARFDGSGAITLQQRRSFVGLGWSLPVRLGVARVELVPRAELERFAAEEIAAGSGRHPDVETITLSAGADLATRVLDVLELSLGARLRAALDAGPLARPDVLGSAGGTGLGWRAQLEFVPENVGLGVSVEGRGLRLEGEGAGAAAAADDQRLRAAVFVSVRG